MKVTDWPKNHFVTSLYCLGSSECDQSGIPFSQKYEELFFRDRDGAQPLLHIPRILDSFSLKKTVCQLVCGGMHSLALLSTGDLWAWGCSDNGVLGYEGEGVLPRRVPIDAVVVQCSAGDTHSMAITVGEVDERDVYFWGIFRVRDRQNGDGEMCEAKTAPELISPKEFQYHRPLKLASGFNHVVLLTQDNKLKKHLFAWGDFSGGKIGRIPSSRRRTQNALKIRALAAKGVTNVWACGNHSFYQYEKKPTAKCPEGKRGLCGWGLNNDGQLGMSHCKEVVTAVEVPFFNGMKVLEVTGGEFHTLVLTERHVMYSFGLNRDGQLGIGDEVEFSSDPVIVDIPEEVVRIASGTQFNYAITTTGKLYSWGQGDNFVLVNQSEKSLTVPTLVNPGLFNSEAVLEVAAGGQHCLFLTSDLQSHASRPSKRSADSKLEASPKRKKK